MSKDPWLLFTKVVLITTAVVTIVIQVIKDLDLFDLG